MRDSGKYVFIMEQMLPGRKEKENFQMGDLGRDFLELIANGLRPCRVFTMSYPHLRDIE
jgi:hypothetical protein